MSHEGIIPSQAWEKIIRMSPKLIRPTENQTYLIFSLGKMEIIAGYCVFLSL